MEIIYKINAQLNILDIIEVYRQSGIKRPVDDVERIMQMYEHSNLVVSAWHENELVGVSRSLTDFCYCCYLSDLAVKESFQHKGIGKEMIRITKEKVGDKVTLLLTAAPAAIDYYPKIGMEKADNAFIIKRLL